MRRALVSSLAAAALFVPGVAVVTAVASNGTPVNADGPTGMDLTDAFRVYGQGSPDIVIAYIEGGINWHGPGIQELADHSYINWRDVPVPCTGDTMVVSGRTEPCHIVYTDQIADYDILHQGYVNVEEWKNDPRVHDANHNGILDPEDLIASFPNAGDRSGDGYRGDIAGWDFYDNQNDPATDDATYDHSDDQMLTALHACPRCMILPIRAGNEAIDRTSDLAKAWLYAYDAGARVIDSVTADLGYSTFMRQAIDFLWAHGVAMTEASNDFDSTDHQGGMFHQDVIPGNGVVARANNVQWTRSDETSWGPHNIVSVAGQSSTSASTGEMGGLLGLVMSYGLQAYRSGVLPAPFTGRQATQVLQETATRVTNPNLPWPGAPGEWNPQYGYGIVNMYGAGQMIAAGDVPPAPTITSPDWYSLYDPTRVQRVPVDAWIDNPYGKTVRWQLDYGLGPDPFRWTTIGTGSADGSYTGVVGTLNLSQIPQWFWTARFHLSSQKSLPTADEYDVTLRLQAWDGQGRRGVTRRVISVYHDPTWLRGFPLRFAGSGESQPALVDLQGGGHLDIVFGTTDGAVDAIDPATGRELPGWPVHTDPVPVIRSHPGVDPGDEPIVADVAVGDLFHTGHEDVVATTEAGRVYAWDAGGRLLPGWPRLLDRGVPALPIPRPADQYTRPPAIGALAAPVLVDLGGDGRLDIVQAGWDGYLHAFTPTGANVPGWPVRVALPASMTPPPGFVFIDDQKLEATPCVAYLFGRSQGPDIVIRSQQTWVRGGSGVQEGAVGFAFAYNAHGQLLPNWPVALPGAAEYYGSAQEFITEGTSSPVSADPTGTGAGPDIVAVGPVLSPPEVVDGAGQVIGVYGAAGHHGMAFGGTGPAPHDNNPPYVDTTVAFATSGSFGKVDGVLRFAQAEVGALSLIRAELNDNSGAPIEEYEGMFPAAGGLATPGYPAPRQGLNFLGSPIFVDVTGSGQPDLVDGGDSSALNATNDIGQTVPGWPKWTTGWDVFAPSAGDLFGSGHTDLVMVTREGYLFAWATPGVPSGNDEWWRWQHDEHNSGNYETQTRPPGAATGLAFTATGVRFRLPGAVWYDGVVPTVLVRYGDVTLTLHPGLLAGRMLSVAVPASVRSVTVQAVGRDGLLGLPVTVSR
jgi:hypothetical protein